MANQFPQQPRDSRGLHSAWPSSSAQLAGTHPATVIGRTVGLLGAFIHVAGGVCLHLLVMRLVRAKGCHVGMQYMVHQLGYAEPQSVEPRDEVAELQRQFVEATKAMAAMAARMEQLQEAGTTHTQRQSLRAA